MTTKSLNTLDRGSVFDDPFFKDSWSDFDSTIQSVFDKFDHHKIGSGSRSEHQDELNKLRNLRNNDNMYASQSVQVTEKDGQFQAELDVKDFNPRELQVRAVDNRIIVEGSFEKCSQDGVNATSKAFYKELVMPLAADIDRVTTALSKDGVLTVKAPKKDVSQIAGPQNQQKISNQPNPYSMNQQTTNDTTAFKGMTSSKRAVQSSSSFESTDSGMESLPRDIRDRLMFSDGSSASGRSSSCASPAPSDTHSEASSEGSRVSTTMEFDIGNKANLQKSEVTFKVGAPASQNMSTTSGFQRNNVANAPPGPISKPLQGYNPSVIKSTPTIGSGASTSVNVSEENGKKILTKESSNIIQERDGFMETKETAAEITDKDSQAARREALTRTCRSEEDPEGKFKRSESANASDVSESCVQRMPDGSIMKVNKSSTSSNSFKQSFSNNFGNDPTSLIDSGFPTDFGDLRSLMGRGHDLMSQMSTDSMGSSLSSRSMFSDMPGFGDMNSFSNFPSMSNMPNMSNFSTRSQNSQSSQSSNDNSSASSQSNKSSFSSNSAFSSSSFNSAFDNMKF